MTAPEEGAGRRATAVGSVAEETELLVQLLSARGWGTPGGRDRSDASDPPGADARGASAESACTCGGQTPQACRVCPVCQLIGFVQQISPETIDRVADVVDLAATALRDLATSRRTRQAPAEQDDDQGDEQDSHADRPEGRAPSGGPDQERP